MKNIAKIIICMMLMTMLFIPNCVHAGLVVGTGVEDDTTKTASEGESTEESGASEFGGAAGEIHSKGTTILKALLWIGYAIALGMVVYIGIKYIMGAAGAKADMKSAIVSWLIGAFIVFMCTTIIGWVTGIIGMNSADNIISTGGSLMQK